MAAKKAARRKDRISAARSAYVAVSATKPTGEIAKLVDWIRVYFRPPDFHVIEIQNDTVAPGNWTTRASRGFLRFSPDWVCWANKDSKAHTVRFVGASSPIDGSPMTITVPAASPSAWYKIRANSGSFGTSVKYEYFVDVAGPPDGPSIVTED